MKEDQGLSAHIMGHVRALEQQTRPLNSFMEIWHAANKWAATHGKRELVFHEAKSLEEEVIDFICKLPQSREEE